MIADQFSVHRSPGRNRRGIPFVVVVQPNRFRDSTFRVVVPLVAVEELGKIDSNVGPHFVIDGEAVVLDPLQITNVARDVLGPPVTSLAGKMRASSMRLMRC